MSADGMRATKREKIRRWGALALTLAVVLTVGFIFRNSLTDAAASRKQSDAVAAAIKPILDPQEKLAPDLFQALVRKGAHLSEFALLGAELGALFSLGRRRLRERIFAPLFLLLLVGTLDEYLQSFLDRGSLVSDVLLDFAGGAAGLLLAGLLGALLRRRRR